MSTPKETIQIAIEIDVTPGVSGGITQSTQGLVSSLGRLDGPERYVLVPYTAEQRDWIQQYCGPSQRIAMMPAKGRFGNSKHPDPRAGILKRTVRPVLNAVRHAVGRLSPQPSWPSVPLSDGFFESLGCDVLHFPTQSYTLSALPTIYNPHDLQHLHYPQFWTPTELARREVIYRAACLLSHTVVVGSEWIKQDVVHQFGVSPSKVQIIPWASPTAQYVQVQSGQLSEIRQRLGLPEAYAFYPAVTWPHKNHIRLLEALAALRDRRGLVVNLVCTGAKYAAHWPRVEQRVKELNLSNQVSFLGFVSESDLRAIYQMAQFLVLPTLFEADSCPIHEAWSEGVPVASSNHTALPDQVGDAGLLFDAKDVSAIADSIEKMTRDTALRNELIARGRRRVSDFDWERTAKAYRAVYRRAAGATLDEEDRWLLQWDWMRDPGKIFKPINQS